MCDVLLRSVDVCDVLGSCRDVGFAGHLICAMFWVRVVMLGSPSLALCSASLPCRAPFFHVHALLLSARATASMSSSSAAHEASGLLPCCYWCAGGGAPAGVVHHTWPLQEAQGGQGGHAGVVYHTLPWQEEEGRHARVVYRTWTSQAEVGGHAGDASHKRPSQEEEG